MAAAGPVPLGPQGGDPAAAGRGGAAHGGEGGGGGQAGGPAAPGGLRPAAPAGDAVQRVPGPEDPCHIQTGSLVPGNGKKNHNRRLVKIKFGEVLVNLFVLRSSLKSALLQGRGAFCIVVGEGGASNVSSGLLRKRLLHPFHGRIFFDFPTPSSYFRPPPPRAKPTFQSGSPEAEALSENRPCALQCGHLFHLPCVEQVFQSGRPGQEKWPGAVTVAYAHGVVCMLRWGRVGKL